MTDNDDTSPHHLKETGCWSRYLQLRQYDASSSSSTKKKKPITGASSTKPKKVPQSNANYIAPGFTKPPLFQSELIAFRPRVNKRGGGRGVFAVKDIRPGTLLMSEIACSSIPDTPSDRE